jgi:hypothetical protein
VLLISVELIDRSRPGDFNHFRGLTDLQLELHVGDHPGVQNNAGIRGGLEAGGFGAQLVGADRQLFDHIVAAGVGRGRDGEGGSLIRDRDLGVRNGCTRGIGYGASKLAVLNLRESAKAQSQHGKYCEAELQSSHLHYPLETVAVIFGVFTEPVSS